MRTTSNTVVLWTGGKDSALAMHRVISAGRAIHSLVTFAPPQASFLAHPLPVMRRQADALGLPHQVIQIAPPYDVSYRQAIAELIDKQHVGTLVTGDIDLVAGLPNWIRQCAAGLAVDVQMPLWGQDRQSLMEELIAASFEVVFSYVKRPHFDESWLGRRIDRAALAELRQMHEATGLDVCGENGEYHTLVLNGPGFHRRVDLGPCRKQSSGEMMYLEMDDDAPAQRIAEVHVSDHVYRVELTPDEDGGFVAEVVGLPGCITQADTYDEILTNAQDAITTWLDAAEQLAQRGRPLAVDRKKAGRESGS